MFPDVLLSPLKSKVTYGTSFAGSAIPTERPVEKRPHPRTYHPDSPLTTPIIPAHSPGISGPLCHHPRSRPVTLPLAPQTKQAGTPEQDGATHLFRLAMRTPGNVIDCSPTSRETERWNFSPGRSGNRTEPVVQGQQRRALLVRDLRGRMLVFFLVSEKGLSVFNYGVWRHAPSSDVRLKLWYLWCLIRLALCRTQIYFVQG